MNASVCPVAMRGIVPSLHTPFDANGAVDLASVRRLVDHTIATGCAGMLALAVASEARALTPAENDVLAETIIDQTAGRIPVILSATAPDQNERLRRAKRARDLGADAILAQVPDGTSGDALYREVADIAAAGPDLFVLQDLDWGGPGLPVATIVDWFARIAQFQALKVEVVPAGPKYSAVLAATDGKMHVSGGWAVSQMPDALARGVHAFMPTELETVYVAIWNLWHAGNEEAARALFERVLPVLAFANQHLEVSIRFLKMLRHANGIFAADVCRAPTPDLDAIQMHEAERLIAKAQALVQASPRA